MDDDDENCPSCCFLQDKPGPKVPPTDFLDGKTVAVGTMPREFFSLVGLQAAAATATVMMTSLPPPRQQCWRRRSEYYHYYYCYHHNPSSTPSPPLLVSHAGRRNKVLWQHGESKARDCIFHQRCVAI